MRVSLCMIVKNEEKVLARCLNSVTGCFDELIIVDTGSTDNTKEIAAQFTAQVYDFEWCDDFAAARNFSFSKATCEWIMWLDADDILTSENKDAFLSLKERGVPSDFSAVGLRYDTAYDESGNVTFSYERERIIRRDAPHEWVGFVHEVLSYEGPILHTDIAVSHRSVKEEYPDRNLRIYEKQLATGVGFSPRDMFYFGRELCYHRQYWRALAVLKSFIEAGGGWVENIIEACKISAGCYTALGNTHAAHQCLCESFLYDLPRAEICCEIGAGLMEKGQYSSAAYWYETALRCTPQFRDGSFVDLNCYGYLPNIQLCVCYDRMGDFQKAEQYNLRAGHYRPLSPAYLSNLAYFRSRTSAKEEG